MPSGTASSQAVRILNRHGVRVVDLAVVAGTTPATVSRWLSGQYNYPSNFPIVLAKFVDDADDVLAAIPVAKEVAHAS